MYEIRGEFVRIFTPPRGPPRISAASSQKTKSRQDGIFPIFKNNLISISNVYSSLFVRTAFIREV